MSAFLVLVALGAGCLTALHHWRMHPGEMDALLGIGMVCLVLLLVGGAVAA